jgi:hypothetical protein
VADLKRHNATTRMDKGIEASFEPLDAESDSAWIEGCGDVAVTSAGNGGEGLYDLDQDEIERLADLERQMSGEQA